MEFAFYNHRSRCFVCNLLRDLKNSSFSSSHSLFRTPNGDESGRAAVFGRLVNINLSIRVILDLVDRCTTPAKDTCDRTIWNGKLKNVVGFLLELHSLVGNEFDE